MLGRRLLLSKSMKLQRKKLFILWERRILFPRPVSRDKLIAGSVSIEQNHKSIDVVKKGQSGAGVAVRIEGATQQLFGRHIDEKDLLYSHISRHSIDTLKLPAIKDEVTKEEWALIVKLKGVYLFFTNLTDFQVFGI